MVRMRGGFGVRGGGVRWCRRKRRSEVWSLPGPRRYTALGSAAGRFSPMVPMPAVAGPKVNNHQFLSTVASSLRYNLHQDTMTSSLASSVTSLQSSLQLLDNSISTLDSGVNDFPRLCKVLQTTRVRHMEFMKNTVNIQL